MKISNIINIIVIFLFSFCLKTNYGEDNTINNNYDWTTVNHNLSERDDQIFVKKNIGPNTHNNSFNIKAKYKCKALLDPRNSYMYKENEKIEIPITNVLQGQSALNNCENNSSGITCKYNAEDEKNLNVLVERIKPQIKPWHNNDVYTVKIKYTFDGSKDEIE